MSTNVIRQSEMSVLNSLTSRAPFSSTKSLDRGLVVVQEEVLDVRRAVAEAEHEIGVAEVRVVAHDVPEQRALADHRHRLGTAGDTIAHPHAEATAEQNDLHRFTPHSDDFELQESGRRAARPRTGRSRAAR